MIDMTNYHAKKREVRSFMKDVVGPRDEVFGRTHYIRPMYMVDLNNHEDKSVAFRMDDDVINYFILSAEDLAFTWKVDKELMQGLIDSVINEPIEDFTLFKLFDRLNQWIEEDKELNTSR